MSKRKDKLLGPLPPKVNSYPTPCPISLRLLYPDLLQLDYDCIWISDTKLGMHIALLPISHNNNNLDF